MQADAPTREGRGRLRGSEWLAGAFVPGLLGLSCLRIWLQVCLYGSYAASDAGTVTVVSNFSYSAMLLVCSAYFALRPDDARPLRLLPWVALVLMTTATAMLFMATVPLGPTGPGASGSLLVPAAVLAGIAAPFGGGTMVDAYRRLGVRSLIFHASVSLGLGSLAGLVLGFLPLTTSVCVAMFMPACILLCQRQALRRLDALGDPGGAERGGARATGAPAAPTSMSTGGTGRGRAPGGAVAPDDGEGDQRLWFDHEPLSTPVILLGGIALVSFALGITRGLSPQGPIPMDAVMRCVHQLGVVAISAGIAWYGGVLGRRVSAAALWGIDIAVVAVGILLVPALPRGLAGLGVALANLGDTLSLGIVWMLAMDYARHASVSAFAVVGAAWFARIFFRDVARTIAPTLVAASVAVDALAGAVVLALAGAMAILLTGIVPRGHKLLDDGTPAEGEVACCALTGGGVRGAAAAGASGAPGHVASVLRGGSAGDPFGARVELLREECGLTEREAQVCALIASGRNKTGVAERLSLSENTVRTHSKNAYAKLGIHTKEELVSLIERLEGRHGIGL